MISGLSTTNLSVRRVHHRQQYVNLIHHQITTLLILNKYQEGDEFFSAINNFGKSAVGDPLEDYLNSPPISSVSDPIMWWNGLSNNGNDPFARMAINVLLCAGTVSF